MKRTFYLILFSVITTFFPLQPINAQPFPNIVFIFADDMGYGDVSGLNPFARTKTPAIDKLIGNGITFTEAHASASVCTPSRYGLLDLEFFKRAVQYCTLANGTSSDFNCQVNGRG